MTFVHPRDALVARRAAGGKAIVPYLTAGYPDWDTFDLAASGLREAGADVFELGVPFSDPLADGKTIQRASQAALEAGVTLSSILDRVESRGRVWGLPVVLMTYANPIVAFGVERFCRRARECGVGGVLVSDLPPEEMPELWDGLGSAGIETTVLVAPTTKAQRLPRLAAAASGFLYCVSRTGVTGAGRGYAANLGAQVAALRALSDLPIVVGFGIRSPEDAVRVARGEGGPGAPDGVVLGARLIEALEEGGGGTGGPDAVIDLVAGVRRALDRPGGPGAE